jgi:hypothetical protein
MLIFGENSKINADSKLTPSESLESSALLATETSARITQIIRGSVQPESGPDIICWMPERSAHFYCRLALGQVPGG